MSSILKGNFTPKNPVADAETTKADNSVEARFEREALKRLGGSIAFVAKKKVMWSAEPQKKADKSTPTDDPTPTGEEP